MGRRERPEEPGVDAEGSVDEGRVHPHQQRGIVRRVAGTGDPFVHRPDAGRRPLGLSPGAEDDRVAGVEGAA